MQEHYLTKNVTSIREHFQNLPMMSKGIIKTCPNFISSTTKKTEYWIFSFPPNWQSLFSIFPTISGRKTILSRKLPLSSSTFKTKPLFFTSSPHSRRLREQQETSFYETQRPKAPGARLLPAARQNAYLQIRLGMGGQKRLSRTRQEGLPRRDERPRGRWAWLAEVKDPHWTWRLEGRPDGPLSRKHGLLSLLIERWSRLSER